MNTVVPIYELFERKNSYPKWRNRKIKSGKEDTLMMKLNMYFNVCFDLLFFIDGHVVSKS